MSDLVPLAWWEHLEQRDDGRAREATLRAAAMLVQDGVTGVRLILPRVPGVVVRARLAARAAGVDVRADQIASASITLRFSRTAAVAPRQRTHAGPPLAPRGANGNPTDPGVAMGTRQPERGRRRWLPVWLRPRARSTG